MGVDLMRIFSWNVNGVRAVLRKGALQEFLAAERPDVVCLQEIKAKPEQVEEDFAGYKVFWNPAERSGYSGTAILVAPKSLEKSPVVRRVAWENALAVQEGRVLILEFEQFFLVDVYTPNAKPDLSRLGLREKEWDPDFLKLLKKLEQEKPVVTCGDFNAAHTEIDLARPKENMKNAGFTKEERQGVTNLINGGFVDTFRQLHPTEQRYSWWSHWGKARERNVGWRIDYFFVSERLLEKLRGAEIYEKYQGSDHCPIGIELEVE